MCEAILTIISVLIGAGIAHFMMEVDNLFHDFIQEELNSTIRKINQIVDKSANSCYLFNYGERFLL